MTVEVSRIVDAPREQIFAILADGWMYASWVVGASHIRDVDPGWPAVGTRIHHCVGPWPLQVRDQTEVLAVNPPRMLELKASAWPFGQARVRLELEPLPDGRTEVRMQEEFISGPARLLPHAVQVILLAPRNRESLSRLADLAEGRTPARPPGP
jgi:uncharacterized protein YndB with AHSA1/START domain